MIGGSALNGRRGGFSQPSSSSTVADARLLTPPPEDQRDYHTTEATEVYPMTMSRPQQVCRLIEGRSGSWLQWKRAVLIS